jgi:serine/threonine protein kinase
LFGKTAAESLSGLQLEGGWTVGERLDPPGGTGGRHSVGYLVTSNSGVSAFLKALDISGILQNSPDIATALNELTGEYTYERDVVLACAGMSRIVKSLGFGQAHVSGSQVGPVPYLIFELAEHGDVRRHLDRGADLSLAWKIQVLHHIALALSQLHSADMSHGDVKPSNIMVFDGVCKLGDLGCASIKGRVGLRDRRTFAGDPAYPPLELYYGYEYADWDEHRLGVDLYLLGSIAVFLILQVGTTAAVLDGFPDMFLARNWGGTFDEVIPYLYATFSKVLDNVRDAIDDPEIADRLCAIISELCNPDPRLRGLPRSYRAPTRFALDRYVSRLGNLLQLAKYKSKRTK